MANLTTIRTYSPTDKQEVVDLIKLNTPKFFAPSEKEDLIAYLDHQLEYYYVVSLNNKIIGCGGINFQDGNTIAKISWDLFHPDYQGKTFGTTLLKYRLDKIKTISSIQKILVRTSQLAYLFYQKQGFELLEIKSNYWAEGFDMYFMQYRQP